MNTQVLKDKNGRPSGLAAKSKPELVQQLLTKWETQNLGEAIFLEDGGEKQRCPCGKPTTFAAGRYQRFCSVSCGARFTAKRGSEHHLSKPEVIQKRVATNVERYGVDNPMKRPEVKARSKETCEERYGAGTFLGSEIGRKKVADAVYAQYGVENISQVPHLRSAATTKAQQGWLRKRLSEIDDICLPLFEQENWTGSKNEHLWKCRRCENEFLGWLKDGLAPRCPTCFPYSISAPQQRVSDFLAGLGIEHHHNDRTIIAPKELDIVIPSMRLAIEVNGLYWHTESDDRPPDYHLQKSLAADRAGYRLIHIFDDEIERALPRLAALFSTHRTYARSYQVDVDVPVKEARRFLDQFHAAGAGPGAKHYVGLRKKGQLAAVASFGKNRWSSKTEWELLRMAFAHKIIGGASRMFKAWTAEVNPTSVLSYSERRWNVSSAVYRELGFELDGATPIDYWYVGEETNWKRAPRQRYQPRLLREGPADTRTELQLTQARGLRRVFGCGNLRWIWRAINTS